MRIQATLHAMAEGEILSMLNHGEYLRIKAFDPKPLFRAYVVGHEGEFTPTAVGIGRIVTKWFEGAVRKLRDQIELGTKLFLGHGETNVHDNRQSVGEVVGTALKTIKDKLSVVAIAYIRPEFRDIKLDIASIEAEVELSLDEEKGVYDAEVKDITGIALGDSSEQTPAFTGATLIGEMQAFVNQSQQYTQGGGMDITTSGVRDFIRSNHLKPSDLFGLEDLTSDPLIQKHVSTETRDGKSDLWNQRQREKDEFEKRLKDIEDKQKEKETALTKERDDALKLVRDGKIPTLVEQIKKERKLDDNQTIFIDRAIKKFSTPEKLDDLEKDLNSFFDAQIKEHLELGEAVYGVPKAKEKDPDPNKNKGGGGGNGGDEPTSEGMADMSLGDE